MLDSSAVDPVAVDPVAVDPVAVDPVAVDPVAPPFGRGGSGHACYSTGREIRLMSVLKLARRARDPTTEPTDDQLLALFHTRPERAWDLFIDRYADLILSCLRHLGFRHDEAMDRFVYICEKLSDKEYRRLKTIRFTGSRGELVPWIRTVVARLSTSWAWSAHGRRRLFRSIASLPEREQRVFELHFWSGLTPSRVLEQLRVELQGEISLADILDALEVIFAHLSDHQRWRLMSNLSRSRETVAIAAVDPRTGAAFEPAASGADAEETLLCRERCRAADRALADLAPRDRLIVQLRYEKALSLAQVAEIVNLSVATVKSSIRSSLETMRRQAAERGDVAC